MTPRMLTAGTDKAFSTWTNPNDLFEKYPFNEHQIDLTEIINLSQDLLDSILEARASLPNVQLMDGDEIFED